MPQNGAPLQEVDDLVGYEVDDPVAVITLNRPGKLNALTYPMLTSVRAAFARAEADPAVVGIVIIARPDAAEGAASLIERRPPNFGRLGDRGAT